jgi:hypothetical protein
MKMHLLFQVRALALVLAILAGALPETAAALKKIILIAGHPATLDDTATIVLISDGGDRTELDHPLYVGNHLDQLERRMRRGCGFLQFHWTTFHPSRVHDRITDWAGGYFDYGNGVLHF